MCTIIAPTWNLVWWFMRNIIGLSLLCQHNISTSNITSKEIDKYFQRHVLPETIILRIIGHKLGENAGIIGCLQA